LLAAAQPLIRHSPSLILSQRGGRRRYRGGAFRPELPSAGRRTRGGHNVTGHAVCDGGLVIDLSRMKGLRIDPVAQIVYVEPGLTWGELNHDLQVFGLGASGGFLSLTGIPGLTLGGGFGWLVRKHGLAMDSLLGVDMVTADGRFLTVSSTQHADLFWGVRGGGGNFGVVTSLEFQVHPVGTVGERVLKPFRDFGQPLVDAIQPMPYSVAQTMADVLWPPGHHHYWKSSFLTDLSDEAIATITGHFATVPSPQTVVLVEHDGGGAIRRIGRDETAYTHRDLTYNFLITSAWADPADSERNIRWTRAFWGAMQPFLAPAVYVNYTSDAGDDVIKAAYAADIHARLVALKNTYDPTNFFRLNQNIKPTV
jgi:hypothetical protein